MTDTEFKIKEMKDAGNTVHITHYRLLNSGETVLTYNNNRGKIRYGKKPEYNPCGGFTRVKIGNFDREFFADCSSKDHFNFKLGTLVAISRAYSFFLELRHFTTYK